MKWRIKGYSKNTNRDDHSKNKLRMKKLICLLMIAVGITAHAQNPYKKFTQNLPFKMSEVKAPVIPNRQVNLRDFGAVNDGVTLNTQAFAKAIETLYGMGELSVEKIKENP